MKQLYRKLLFSAAALAMMSPVYAQESETPEDPEVLTIAYDVTNPVPGVQQSLPRTFTIDFSASGMQILKVTDNTSYTSQAAEGGEGDTQFEGLYAYVEWEQIGTTGAWPSGPMKVTVNSDNTVTLTVDTSGTPSFGMVFMDSSLAKWRLVIPQGLLTVQAKNLYNKTLDYVNVGGTYEYLCTHDYQFATPVCNPADGSTISTLKKIDLDFNITVDTEDEVQWACMANQYAKLYVKKDGEASWSEGPGVTVKTTYLDPRKSSITVSGVALADKGQYRLHIPAGTFDLIAQKAEGSSEIDLNIAYYTNPDMDLRFAIGENVEAGADKADFLVSAYPPEGDVNLNDYPSGVEFIRMIFNSVPVIDRTVSQNITLSRDGEVIKTISPKNQTYFKVQQQGIVNPQEHEVHLWFDEGESNIDLPGVYSISFPANLFKVGEETIGAFKLEYQIDPTIVSTLAPFAEAVVDDLGLITVTFPDATAVALNEGSKPTISLTRVTGSSLEMEVSCDKNIASLTNKAESFEPGVYNLKIPAGYFLVTIDGKQLRSNEIVTRYKVPEVQVPAIDPAEGVLPGNTVYKITLTLPEDMEISSINKGDTYNRLCRLKEDGTVQYVPVVAWFNAADPEGEAGGNKVTLTPRSGQPVTLENGRYIFICAQYLFNIGDGRTSDEYKYIWEVNKESLPQPKLIPAGAIKSLEGLSLEMPEGVTVTSVTELTAELYSLGAAAIDAPVATFTATLPADNANRIDLTVATQDDNISAGKYELRTPNAFFSTEKFGVPAYVYPIEISQAISGIAEIAGIEDATVTAFTIEGICVLRDADRSELDRLPCGLYIVNGKKLIKY